MIFVGVFCSSSEELGHGTRGLLSTERPQVRFAIDLYGAFPVKRSFAIKSENRAIIVPRITRSEIPGDSGPLAGTLT